MDKILFGAVKPEGELRASMERDMNGCIGHLEELAPTIVCDQKIYGADRLTRVSKQADLGRKPDEHEDKDITLILDYSFRRLFGANTNLLLLSCIGKTKEQIMPEVMKILNESTQYKKYLEEYK